MIKRLFSSDIFRNFSYLSISEIISKALAFIATIYIARVLGPENFGKLGFAQAILSYFVLIVNLGFDVYGAIEVAKNKDEIKRLLVNITVIKTILFIVAYMLLFITVLLIPKDWETKKFILFYGLTLIFPIITIEWLFQGIENFKLIAVGRILRNLVYTLLILVFVHKNNQLYDIVLFQILGTIAGMSILWKFVIGNNYFSITFIDIKKWKEYLKTGFILGSSFFMISIYYNLDKVMIGFWYPDKYVGWYDAAYKISMLCLTIGGLLWSVYLPKIAHDRKKTYFYIKIMLTFSFFWLIILTNFNKTIISIVFGNKFMEASIALFILAFNTALIYINGGFVSPIMLWNEKKYIKIIAMGAITNIIFNFILIPKYDIKGAAIATCLAEVAVFLFGIFPFLKEVKNG